MAEAPTVKPGSRKDLAPMKALSSIVMGATIRGFDGIVKSWLAVQRYASCATVAPAQSVMGARL
jgi:hypothetical protein